MRRHLSLIVGLSLLSASAPAAAIQFTPFAGYTTVNMTTVNESINAAETFIEVLGSSGPGLKVAFRNNQKVTSAWVVGGELLSDRLTPWQSLSLGVRGEYLQTNLGQLTTDSLPGMSLDYELFGNLSNFMLGGRYQVPGDWHGVGLSVGAFAGLGYAEMHQSMAAIHRNDLFNGEGFVGDVDLNLHWAPASFTHTRFNALLGYRYASLGNLSNGAGQPLKPLTGTFLAGLPGSPFVNHQGGMDVDFSGLNVGGGFSLSF